MTKTVIERSGAGAQAARHVARFLVGMALSGFLALTAGSVSAATFVDDTAARLPTFPYDSNTLAAGDVDGDGHPDVLIGVNGEARLLINDGTGHFADETAARLPVLSGSFMGASFVDLTGDGRPELFLANAAGQNKLLFNDGSGVFSDQTATRLPADNDVSMGVAAGDVNGDGFVDFVVANRGAPARRHRPWLWRGAGGPRRHRRAGHRRRQHGRPGPHLHQ